MFYTEYITNDTIMIHLLFAYCEGRSYFWQMFFGWRSTNNEKVYRFIVPTRKIAELETLAKSLEREL